jgi:hypothetical protein
MNCNEVKYYLSDYSKGILLDEVRSEIHEHLNYCKSCTKILEDIITITSETGIKKRNLRSRKKVLEKIHEENEKNSSTKKIIPKIFSSASAISSEADHLKNSLMLKANEIENNKLFVIAGIISVIALGVILAYLIFDHSPSTFGSVEKISGYPIIESRVLTDQGVIKIGEKLFTDSESRARLKVGAVGEIEIEPQSEIQITETKSSEYRLVLSKGKILARTWVVPKLFSIKTPSAVITDLGCLYYLTVDEKSSTTIEVKSGWVLMENNKRKSLLPAGTRCYSEISKNPGTPFLNDASASFKEALFKLDFENGGKSELKKLLAESRREDLISLFHLLKYLDQESRGKIYDRISILFKIPQRITREGIISGDNDMMGRMWTELGLGSISIYQNL